MAGALIKLSKLIASGTTGPTMMDSPCMSLGLRRLSGLTPKPATTKIGVVIRSFDNPLLEKNFLGLPPNTGKIGLPDSRVLYTVLRSPHIDKKSREQFEMRIKKRYLVIEAERHELHKKFFWLKRQRIFGAQYEIKFSCNTRLDKGKLQKLLAGSSSLDDALSNIWGIPRAMFEKAIKVIMLAQEESRLLGHNSVGTEQILLGLIGEGSVIAAKAVGIISLEDARVEVEKIIGRGSGIVDAEISFTPRAKRLLELSLEESRQLGHDYIGAEHLLLGLLREGEAARVLENLGADPTEIRKQVISMMRETAETVSADDKGEE